MVDSIDAKRFHPFTSVSDAAFNANDALPALEVAHDCARPVIGILTQPAAHDELCPFATVTLPCLATRPGCARHRTAEVATAFVDHTSNAVGLHEYDHDSYNFNDAD